MDPTSLLDGLSSLLNTEGALAGNEQATSITRTMRHNADKLVTRAVFLNIIQATKSTEVLIRFVNAGGWAILNDWLQDAKTEMDEVFLCEILRLYLHLPVTVELMRKTSCAKTISKLSKSSQPEFSEAKEIAAQIVDLWTKKIRSQPDKINNKKVTTQLSTAPSSSSNLSNHNQSTPVNGTVSQQTKPKPKRRAGNSSKVGTHPGHSRLTGLIEEDVHLPGKKKKPSPVSAHNKMTGANVLDKIMGGNTKAGDEYKTAGFPSTSPRVVVAQPKESTGFMDAIAKARPTSVGTLRLRRRKVAPTQTIPSPQSSPLAASGADVHFYKDTLNNMAISPQDSRLLSPAEVLHTRGSESSLNESLEDQPMADAVLAVGPPKKKVSWASEANLKTYHYFQMDDAERVNVVKLSWEEMQRKDKLLDRASMDKLLAAKARMPGDPLTTTSGRGYVVSKSRRIIDRWRRPRPLDGLPTHTEAVGANSTEKETQRKREQTVLQALYLNKNEIPLSAAEPDQENEERSEPVIIPLDDDATLAAKSAALATNTGPSSVLASPSPQRPSEGPVSLAPNVAQLLNQMATKKPDSSVIAKVHAMVKANEAASTNQQPVKSDVSNTGKAADTSSIVNNTANKVLLPTPAAVPSVSQTQPPLSSKQTTDSLPGGQLAVPPTSSTSVAAPVVFSGPPPPMGVRLPPGMPPRPPPLGFPPGIPPPGVPPGAVIFGMAPPPGAFPPPPFPPPPPGMGPPIPPRNMLPPPGMMPPPRPDSGLLPHPPNMPPISTAAQSQLNTSAAQTNPQSTAPLGNRQCHFFNSKRGCKDGDRCRFLHTRPEQAAETTGEKDTSNVDGAVAESKDTGKERENNGGRNNFDKERERAYDRRRREDRRPIRRDDRRDRRDDRRDERDSRRDERDDRRDERDDRKDDRRERRNSKK